MMKPTNVILNLCLCAMAFAGCRHTESAKPECEVSTQRALSTLDSLYAHYGVEGTALLRENYPSDIDNYKATYLASDAPEQPNLYSYLWPYSGTFSAVTALMHTSGDGSCASLLQDKVLPGLNEYFDTRRSPAAYASYISSAPQSDRFYDDNIWLGIDFADAYQITRKAEYLDSSKLIWQFIESGTDDLLGGGIYWCEQKKHSKNTCSNAPGSVLALKLFEATGDSTYFHKGKALYEWTQTNLQDSTDGLYFDNISLEGKVQPAKFAYNSGQMMQSAALLYKLTRRPEYLAEAQRLAKACHNYFFQPFSPEHGEPFHLIKKGDIWFTAVMMRGFAELYQLDRDDTYLHSFARSLDYAWTHARDAHGLFNTDFSGHDTDERKWLLTQAAVVEMYARLASLGM